MNPTLLAITAIRWVTDATDVATVSSGICTRFGRLLQHQHARPIQHQVERLLRVDLAVDEAIEFFLYFRASDGAWRRTEPAAGATLASATGWESHRGSAQPASGREACASGGAWNCTSAGEFAERVAGIRSCTADCWASAGVVADHNPSQHARAANAQLWA